MSPDTATCDSEPAISYQEAVDLLLSNEFALAEKRFLRDSPASSRHALLYAQVGFASAALSLDPSDIEEAIARYIQIACIAFVIIMCPNLASPTFCITAHLQ